MHRHKPTACWGYSLQNGGAVGGGGVGEVWAERNRRSYLFSAGYSRPALAPSSPSAQDVLSSCSYHQAGPLDSEWASQRRGGCGRNGVRGGAGDAQEESGAQPRANGSSMKRHNAHRSSGLMGSDLAGCVLNGSTPNIYPHGEG